jgi:ABC-2 type transport system permease protein
MASVVAFALMLSTLTDASFGAVAGGVGLAVVSEIMDGISPLHRIRLGLPTHYWDAWNGLLSSPVHTADMVRGALAQAGYAAVFLGIAFWWFGRKDVLS